MNEENCKLKIPTGVRQIEVEIAYLALKGDVIYSISKNVKRTTANVKEFFDSVRKLSGNKKVYMISETTYMQPYTAQVKKYFNEEMIGICKGLAVVSCRPLGKIVPATVILSQKPPFPVRIFDTSQEACDWIEELQKRELSSP
ncbi:MAG: hypothetical protein ACJ77K_17090 [Bacteroidia bacterium]